LEAPKSVIEERKDGIKNAPTFLKHLDQIGQVPEGSTVHLETFVEPKDDPNLKITWYHEGKIVEAGSRSIIFRSYFILCFNFLFFFQTKNDQRIWFCRSRHSKR